MHSFSSKEKHDKELVIPCRKTTDSLLDKLKINNENTLENQAAKEIIQGSCRGLCYLL